MTRDFKYFSSDVIKRQQLLAKYIAKDAPRHVGKIAVDHYKQNFDKEGFANGGLQKWREVKRRQPPVKKGAAGRRKILRGETLELMNSIQYRPEPARTIIFSDVEYFSVHQEGLKAGRKGAEFDMPKRQIVGDSQELTIKINDRLKSDFRRILTTIK